MCSHKNNKQKQKTMSMKEIENVKRVSVYIIHKYIEHLPNKIKYAGQTSMRICIHKLSRYSFLEGEFMNLLLRGHSADCIYVYIQGADKTGNSQ